MMSDTMANDEILFHSWSAQGPRNVPAFASGEGSWLTAEDGQRYLDFGCQLVFTNLGHQHPTIISAIKAQADRLCTIAPSFANDTRGEAARMITEVAPDGLNHVFFTTAGTEANEHATRMARRHTGRPKLLAAYRSYHGATATSIHMTGEPRRWANDTGAAGVVHFFGPYLYRSAFGASTPEEESQRALAHLEQVIALEGPTTIAGLILESVVGSAGLLPPPPGYLQGVRDLCTKHGIVYIADEVMVGFGRTGTWFGVDPAGVSPDLVTFAKGVNSGYVPLGGVLISDEIRASFVDRPYPGGLTYSGHPLACAAAVGALTAMHEEKIVAASARLGTDVLGPGLHALAAKHPSVGDVRGLGAFWALELVRDQQTREPMVPYAAAGPANAPMAAIGKAALDNQLLVLTMGNRIHVTPPLNLSDEDAAIGLRRLDAVLTVADAQI
jgi:taurine--2-oxoglutarate transaminase